MEHELRTSGPVGNNVHNLVQTLSTKLDSVTRYRIYIEDAQAEGEQECVDLFKRLEQQDTAAVHELQRHLSSRIGRIASESEVSGRGDTSGQGTSKAA